MLPLSSQHLIVGHGASSSTLRGHASAIRLLAKFLLSPRARALGPPATVVVFTSSPTVLTKASWQALAYFSDLEYARAGGAPLLPGTAACYIRSAIRPARAAATPPPRLLRGGGARAARVRPHPGWD